MNKVFQTIDLDRASESLAGMVADWYGNAPLPNARITAEVIAQRLDRFAVKSVLSLTSADLSEAVAALKACVAAMHNDHPGDNEYWKAAELAEYVIMKVDFRQVCPDEVCGDHGSEEHAQTIVRDARALLDRLVMHAPDHGVDEFLDAIRDARLLVAKIDGAE